MAYRTPRLHLPMRTLADVVPYLGAAHHDRPGRSARLVAETWFRDQGTERGLPAMIAHVLDQHPRLHGAALVDAFPERKTALRDGSRPSQADVMAVLALSTGLAVMTVEGKVDESFGPRVSEWLR